MSGQSVPKALSEGQAKVMDFMSPGAVFIKSDLLRLTELQANQLTPILRSLCVRGLIEEFVDDSDPSQTVQYRPTEDANAPETSDVLDEIPANTTPEDVADIVLDLSQGEMVTIDISDEQKGDAPTTGEMGAYYRPDLAPTPMPAYEPKNLVPVTDIKDIALAMADKPDQFGFTVKGVREKYGQHEEQFAPGEIGELVKEALGIIFRESVGLPRATDPITVAMQEERETWQELSKDGDLRTPAPDYITRNIKGREPFARLEEAHIGKMVVKFLGIEEPAPEPETPATPLTPSQQIQAKIDAKNKAKIEKQEQTTPKSSNGTPRAPKTDFSSENAGAYYIRHGVHKGSVKFSAYWQSNKKYVRLSITTEKMTYNPQVFAGTKDAVVAKMTKFFPNATFTGDVLESDTI